MNPQIPLSTLAPEYTGADFLSGMIPGTASSAPYMKVVFSNETFVLYAPPPLPSSAMKTYFQGQEAVRREKLARAFAKGALAVPGVQEVRLSANDDELGVTALTADRDMERDLRLHALFLNVTSDLDDPARLRILVFDPEHAADAGTLLT